MESLVHGWWSLWSLVAGAFWSSVGLAFWPLMFSIIIILIIIILMNPAARCQELCAVQLAVAGLQCYHLAKACQLHELQIGGWHGTLLGWQLSLFLFGAVTVEIQQLLATVAQVADLDQQPTCCCTGPPRTSMVVSPWSSFSWPGGPAHPARPSFWLLRITSSIPLWSLYDYTRITPRILFSSC